MSDEPRLLTHIMVGAAVRQGAGMGIPVTVAKRGEAERGAVLIKLNRGPAGCTALVQGRNLAGDLVWQRATGPEPVPEATCDAYVAKALHRDPDLWVVEVEDRAGRHLFAGAVE
jgi:hypothetical protein